MLIHLKGGHYYVLSRFLISRALESVGVLVEDAAAIALQLKKELVEHNLLNISSKDLGVWLVWILALHGYGDLYYSRFRMISQFFQQRLPLVIMITGTGCVGKSTVATQLARQLNLPNVLQTDMVFDIMSTMEGGCTQTAGAEAPSLWESCWETDEAFLAEYKHRAYLVRRGLLPLSPISHRLKSAVLGWPLLGVDFDLHKALKEGKPLIIEGSLLDPSLYTPFTTLGEAMPPPPSPGAASPAPSPSLAAAAATPAPGRLLLSFLTPDCSGWPPDALGPGLYPSPGNPPPMATTHALPRPSRGTSYAAVVRAGPGDEAAATPGPLSTQNHPSSPPHSEVAQVPPPQPPKGRVCLVPSGASSLSIATSALPPLCPSQPPKELMSETTLRQLLASPKAEPGEDGGRCTDLLWGGEEKREGTEGEGETGQLIPSP